MAPNGYWGPTTSTLDWCERNYEMSFYVAELWNTISNVAIFLPPIIGIFQIYKLDLERKYMLAFFVVSIVGFGSWAFHMTLLYPMQLADEIPMVWSAAVMIYMQLNIRRSADSPINWPLMATCFLYAFAYIALIKSLLFTRKVQCKTCTNMVHWVWILLHVAFFLWNIDNNFCTRLEGVREHLPAGLRPATQLHAAWHLLTGIAAYIHVLFLLHSRGHFFKPKVNVKFTRFGFILQKEPVNIDKKL